MASTLKPYLACVRTTLNAGLCLRNFPSQTVERHNKVRALLECSSARGAVSAASARLVRPPHPSHSSPPSNRAFTVHSAATTAATTGLVSIGATAGGRSQREQGAPLEPSYHLPYGQGEMPDRAVGKFSPYQHPD
mmetsp:Transcript_91223/g.260555  ORF Transcript_91223/g.260555 Transcript_91223/m.260555 type:complete len:135 (-) Transcript_91223:678-1082(-)